MSPAGSHFQGGILALLGSAARKASGLKGNTLSAVGSRRLSEEPSLHSLCELFLCCTFLVLTIPITSLVETKACERERKLVLNSGTLYGGRGGRKQQIQNVRREKP